MGLQDAPTNSLIDSTSSPKVKIVEGEGIGVCSLIHNTLGVEGHVGAPGWGLG
jgi:hypothetical protein